MEALKSNIVTLAAVGLNQSRAALNFLGLMKDGVITESLFVDGLDCFEAQADSLHAISRAVYQDSAIVQVIVNEEPHAFNTLINLISRGFITADHAETYLSELSEGEELDESHRAKLLKQEAAYELAQTRAAIRQQTDAVCSVISQHTGRFTARQALDIMQKLPEARKLWQMHDELEAEATGDPTS